MTNKTERVLAPREMLEKLLTVAALSASAPYRELRALLDAPAEDVRAVGEEPVYLYRRKGFDSWATCDRKRFDMLAVHNCFEVDTLYRRVNACLDAVEELNK